MLTQRIYKYIHVPVLEALFFFLFLQRVSAMALVSLTACALQVASAPVLPTMRARSVTTVHLASTATRTVPVSRLDPSVSSG